MSAAVKTGIAIIAVFVFAIVGWMMRDGLRDFNGKDKSVFVRGLAEREVKADMAVWPLILSATDNDLSSAQAKLEAQETALRTFLQQHGLGGENTLSVMRYDTQDLLAQSYRPDGIDQGRYVLGKTLLLRTPDVDTVIAASQAMDDLVKRNVALGQGSQPSYIFTGLNDIKPDMIREATANALEAAQQFAQDSGAQVGGIVSASQGVFSIEGRDEIPMLGAEGQINKKVRVVTSVTYRLKD